MPLPVVRRARALAAAARPRGRPAVARRRRPRGARAPLRRAARRRLDPAPRRRRPLAAALRRAARRGRRRPRRADPGAPGAARARPRPGRGLPRRRGRDRDRVPPRPRAARARLRRSTTSPRTRRPRPSLELGEIELRGRIDRIDLAPDGRSAIVRDYKTGKAVASADKFSDTGTLQIQLYMLVARRVLGLDPVAGLYQPLGAPAPKDRRPRGVADRDDARLAGLDLVRTDRSRPRSSRRCSRAPRSPRSAPRPDARRRHRPRPAQRRVPALLHLPADLPARARARRGRRRAPGRDES